MTWRYLTAQGGNGVLGDLASHGIDLVNYLLGDVDALVADTAVFVRQRAKPTGATTGHSRVTGGELGTVENDDWVGAQLRLASGARVVSGGQPGLGRRPEQLRIRDPRHHRISRLGFPPAR